MEPVIERPALPTSLPGLVQALLPVCQQYGQRINRLLQGPLHPRTSVEKALGISASDIDTRYAVGTVYRYGGADDEDLTTAIQRAIDVVYAGGGGIVDLPYGAVLGHSDTIVVPRTVGLRLNQSTLKALSGFPATISSDKAGGAAGFTFDAPQLWFDCRPAGRLGGVTINAIDGYLDGNNVAPCGLVITGGANNRIDTIYAFDHTVANFVFDGPQNSFFSNLRARNAPKNYRHLNVTQLCQFVNCNGNEGTDNQVELSEDPNYPSYRIFTDVHGPARNQWFGGIYENFSASKVRTLYVGASSRSNRFKGTSFIGACTTAGIEIDSGAPHTVLEDIVVEGVGADVPALIQRGFRTSVSRARIHDWGTSSLVDLIECYNWTTFKEIFWGNNTFSGKNIANKSATPNDARIITYEPWPNAGSTAQRPTELVDAYMRYYNTQTAALEVYSYPSATWVNAN